MLRTSKNTGKGVRFGKGARVIYYFTGTGNSLQVARLLAESLEEELASIPQLPKGPVTCNDALCGVVFPTYAHTFPAMVREFIARLHVHPGAYVFLVPTFGNPQSAGIAERAAADARALGLSVDHSQGVLMGDNWLPGYDAAAEMAADKDVDGQVGALASDVRARRAFVRPESADERAHYERAMGKGTVLDARAASGLFAVNERCVGCGICARVCPSGAVVLEEGHPVWRDGRCQWCFACINWCPEEAIGFARLPEKNPGARYRNPSVAVDDIIAANDQVPLADDQASFADNQVSLVDDCMPLVE